MDRDRSTVSRSSPNIGATRGLTLIELLVVVAIITTLVAGVVPVLSPNNTPRKIREAGRGLTSYIKLAQAKAARNGRPAGILLKKLSVDSGSDLDRGVCLELFQVEVPPPYSGFTEYSTVEINFNDVHPDSGEVFITAKFGFGLGDGFMQSIDEVLPPRMFKVGDILEVSGHRFRIADPDAYDMPLEEEVVDGIRVDVPRGQDGQEAPFNEDYTRVVRYNGTVYVDMDPNMDPSLALQHLKVNLALIDMDINQVAGLPGGRPYKILRVPELSSEQPYQLPRGTCIDLQASGLPISGPATGSSHSPAMSITSVSGTGGDATTYKSNYPDSNVTNNDDGIVVMFGPDGAISDYLWNANNADDPYWSTTSSDATALSNQVFFLIGRRENVPVSITTYGGWDFPSQAPEEQEELRSNVNWLDGDSRWLAISSRSGNVVVTENAYLNISSERYIPESSDLEGLLGPTASGELGSIQKQLFDARQFAREMKREGGR